MKLDSQGTWGKQENVKPCSGGLPWQLREGEKSAGKVAQKPLGMPTSHFRALDLSLPLLIPALCQGAPWEVAGDASVPGLLLPV